MSSSDSEDDCYGNMAKKLQKIKNTIVNEKIESIDLHDSNELAKTSAASSINVENTSEIVVEDLNTTVNSTDNDEYTLDAIIANNTKAKPKRGRGRKRKTEDTTSPAKRETRSSKRKTLNSNKGRTSPVNPEPSAAPVVQNTAAVEQNIARVQQNTAPVELSDQIATTTAVSRQSERGSSTRGRGGSARGRGRNRGRGNRRELWAIFNQMMERRHNPTSTIPQSSTIYPTYSVGNTDEYPDQSDNQQLFSTKPVTNDVEIIEEDQFDEDNEEMSVKVYWQNLEIFKFKIRKYQKLTQIFEYFTEKEGVSNNKLLFTYNDRILKIDDTPDSINYSIAKFIDGGIVNQNVTQLVQDKSSVNEINGLKIKFQCQNKKKPFETILRPEDKLALAMMKCAEHLETPLERLKFYFDGDLITSKNTPRDLELEGGECIDVKISS